MNPYVAHVAPSTSGQHHGRHGNDRRRWRQCVAFSFPFAVALFYAALVCSHGIPAFRHDWLWPITRQGFIDVFWNAVSGWNSAGLGHPYAYPSSYLLGATTSFLGIILGPLPALWCYVFGVAIACTLSARSLSVTLGCGRLQSWTVQTFVLFNPWVYNETVAGHTYMILAYAGLLGLCAEIMRPLSRPKAIAMLLILTIPQLQFFIFAIVLVLYYAVRHRVMLPLATSLVLGLPIWIGIALERSQLLSTPYTVAWQYSQSVQPAEALLLSGYFTRYAEGLGPIGMASTAMLALCAMAPLTLHRDRKRTFISVGLIFTAIMVAAGTRGPLGHAYIHAVERFPETGVFRELYDVVAIVAIGYAVLLSSNRSRYLIILQATAAALLLTTWAASPPSRFWIDSRNVPMPVVNAPSNTRFALFPAFQPMSFNGQGSGSDPDAYRRGRNVTPLNEYSSRYPANVALSEFAQNGDSSDLRALSVSTILVRPWLETDWASLARQLNSEPRVHDRDRRLEVHHITGVPKLTLDEPPVIGSLVNRLGSGNILFSDAGAGDLIPIKPQNKSFDESQGWVDVRFDFVSHPNLGQGIGGAVTTNRRATLPIASGGMLLVNVTGSLYDQDGFIVARSTGGYRWVRVPTSASSVNCAGRCVVAAQTAAVTLPPLNPAPRRYSAVNFVVFSPWLVRAEIPPHPVSLLRFNVSYDGGWHAFSHTAPLNHERIDASVNGWLLPAARSRQIVYIVHVVAFLQTIGEICGTIWFGLVMLGIVPIMYIKYERHQRYGVRSI